MFQLTVNCFQYLLLEVFSELIEGGDKLLSKGVVFLKRDWFSL